MEAHVEVVVQLKVRAAHCAVHALPLPPELCDAIAQEACRPDTSRTALARDAARRTMRYGTVHVPRFSLGRVTWTFVMRP